MNEILRLTKTYSRKKHEELLPQIDTIIPELLRYLYDPEWETDALKAPYEILTYLLDCYYCLPNRPDLASLFAWQAINHSYNEFLLNDPKKGKLSDSDGIEHLQNSILTQYAKYRPLLFPYLQKLPIKIFHYVAAYMLKGYVLEKKGFKRKYRASSYDTMNKKITIFREILENSFGKAFFGIASPALVDNKVVMNADADKSRRITHSFALKIKELVLNHTTCIILKDTTVTKKTYIFSDKDELVFLIYGVMYASRCNNFHGNSASRLNSINADKETFKMYTDIFLVEYMLLAVSLNIQGKLSDSVLSKIKENVKFMI